MIAHLKANLKFNRTRQVLGIDRAVGYTLFSRGWQLLAGFGSVLLVARFLSPIQQGFQYTFASVLSLQIFFELGLTCVILQFTSHERARLNWSVQGTLEGDPIAKARLASLVRLTLKWYAVAAVVLVCMLVPAGLMFFGNSLDSHSVGIWKAPWIWLVLTTAGSLLLSPLFAVLEGCGLVAEVAGFRFVQDLTTYPVYWIGLAAGLGLLSSPLFQTIRLLASLGWLFGRHRSFFFQQIKFILPGVTIHWWREVWPMQWKIALSWIGGYFIYQLFNPVLFTYFGAVVAGQMGMTLTLTTAVNTLALSWINAKSPTFGQLVARRDYKLLDRLFSRTLLQAFIAAISGGLVLLLIVVGLYAWQIPLSERVLGSHSFVLLTAVAIINVVIFAEAAYLRAHKQEPFLWMSIAMAILSTLSAYFLGRAYGSMGMAAGSFVITVIGLCIATWIFFIKRREWHVHYTM